MRFRIADAVRADRLKQLVRTEEGKVYWIRPPKSHSQRAGTEAGCEQSGNGNKRRWAIKIDGRLYKRAQVVFCLTRGYWASHEVDHRDGDSLNDRPNNLREATHSQNMRARTTHAKASGLPRGVYPEGNRFLACISLDGRQRRLGTFANAELAAAAYVAARQTHFGEFA